jgi:putative transposase
MKNVSGPQVVTPAEALERPLPAQIQEVLGELVGAAREGLLALSVGVGLSVVHELMAAEVEEVVGPKGKHNPWTSMSRGSGRVASGDRPVTRPGDAPA